jgi:hypothetical protein
MDYPSRTRLKILGHAAVYEGEGAQQWIEQLSTAADRKLVERAFVIRVEGFDWNCQQHITPRFTEEQVVKVIAPLRQRLSELEEENKRLRQEISDRAAVS